MPEDTNQQILDEADAINSTIEKIYKKAARVRRD